MIAFYRRKVGPVYTISLAAKVLGVHPRTLRIYEEEGLVCPKRTKSQYRLYSREDLERIQEIMDLMEEWSLNLSGIKAMFEMAEKFHIKIEKLIEEMLD